MSFPLIQPLPRRQQQQSNPLAILQFRQQQQEKQRQEKIQQENEGLKNFREGGEQALATGMDFIKANPEGDVSKLIPLLRPRGLSLPQEQFLIETAKGVKKRTQDAAKKAELAGPQLAAGKALGGLTAARPNAPSFGPNEGAARIQSAQTAPEAGALQGLLEKQRGIADEQRQQRTSQMGQFITLGNRETGDLRTISKTDPKQIQKLLDQGFIQVGAPQITGTAQELGLSTKTTSTIEGELLKATSGLDRLHVLQQTFKPQFQQTGPRITAMTRRIKSKLGQPLSAQETQELYEFSTFKRNAISNINLYIKDITGAQMSELEAKRLRKAVPDPGEGIFDGDDPVTFEANMNATILDLERYAARLHYAQKTGIIDVTKRDAEGKLAKSELNKLEGRLPVERMKSIMGKRHREIAAEILRAKPGISVVEAAQEAAAGVDAEFGMK